MDQSSYREDLRAQAWREHRDLTEVRRLMTGERI
jgi:hypothetical protein